MQQGRISKIPIKSQTLSLLKTSQARTTLKASDFNKSIKGTAWANSKQTQLPAILPFTYQSKLWKQHSILDMSNDNSSWHSGPEPETYIRENFFLFPASTLIHHKYIIHYILYTSYITSLLLRKAVVSPVASAGTVSVTLLEGTFDPRKTSPARFRIAFWLSRTSYYLPTAEKLPQYVIMGA